VEAHNFTVYWSGFFYTGNNPKGDWTFWTNSDDGSYLWVDSQLVVNNGTPHGMQEKSGAITLNTNRYYPIKILFGEIGGGFDMRVSFQGPNVGRRTDGNGFYFSVGGGNVVAANVVATPYNPVTGLAQFKNLLTAKVPWGIYSAENFDNNTKKLIEIGGTGRDAIVTDCTLGSASGNGASANINFLSGTTASTIVWPNGSLPSTFTICSLTRYSGGTKRRILRAAPNTNWLHGHWNGQRGASYYNQWTINTNKGTSTDWLITCGTNSPSINKPNNILINVESGSGNNAATATPIGDINGGTNNGDYLNINNSAGQYPGETSDFQFSQIIIWDQALTTDEMNLVFNQFASYLTSSLYMFKDMYKAVDPVASLAQFKSLLTAKVPWGIYSVENFDNNAKKLIEIGGSGRDAIVTDCTLDTAGGNGASTNIKFLSGTPTSKIIWPTKSIPSTFTMCSLTRYSGNNRGRILNGTPTNWLHGHHGDCRGRVYYDGWKTSQNNIGNKMDWLVTCGTNGTTLNVPNNILYDGVPSGITNGGAAGDVLQINNTYEPSDFQFSQLLIWDQVLTLDEMKLVSNIFSNYLKDGLFMFKDMYKPFDPVAGLVQFKSLLTAKVPWGIYSAENFDDNTKKLIEIGGSGRDAIVTNNTVGSANGNGASANIKFLSGTPTSKIVWPSGSIPATFTICSLTRYSGDNKNRILNGTPTNWLHGHHGNKRSVAHYNDWKTGITNVGTLTDWLTSCGTNSTAISAPNNMLYDGVPSGVANGGSAGDVLHINNTYEPSDYQFSQIIIWDQVLTLDEMKLVSNIFINYLKDGLSMYNKLPEIQLQVQKTIVQENNNPDGNYWIKTSGMEKQDIFYINNSMDNGGWILVHQVDNASRVGNAIVYSVDKKINLGKTVPNRIAYYMENNGQNAWVSFDMWPISAQASVSYDVPTGGSAANVFINKVIVTNLNVISNSPNVKNITGGRGALEIWPSNYGQGKSAYDNNPSNLAIGADGIYDSNDSGFNTSLGYGSFQVHNITDLNNIQTVLAWNRHYDAKPDIGFGNNTANGNTDWTFVSNGATNFKLQIYIQELKPVIISSIKMKD
jgi:hypothetical protein